MAKNITQLDSCKINYLTCKKNYLYTAGDRGILKLDLNGDSLWRRHYNTGPGFTDEYKKLLFLKMKMLPLPEILISIRQHMELILELLDMIHQEI